MSSVHLIRAGGYVPGMREEAGHVERGSWKLPAAQQCCNSTQLGRNRILGNASIMRARGFPVIRCVVLYSLLSHSPLFLGGCL